jgi:hypothetical protein
LGGEVYYFIFFWMPGSMRFGGGDHGGESGEGGGGGGLRWLPPVRAARYPVHTSRPVILGIRVVIEVCRNPLAVIVNGYRIQTAPPVAELLRAIGTPSRVDTGPTPAPPGFRNNQQHVFDSLGVHVNEHHHTCRAQAIGLTLRVDEPRYGFTPKPAFGGKLLFDGIAMPLQAKEHEFLRTSPWPFEHFISGNWSYKFDGFFVGFTAVGPKLASGRRSKQRMVVDVSISWPHDPHNPLGRGG